MTSRVGELSRTISSPVMMPLIRERFKVCPKSQVATAGIESLTVGAI